MFDLTFLGTSARVPSTERNHPGLLVEAGNRRNHGRLRGGHAAAVASARRRLSKTESASANAWPFRSCAGDSRPPFDASPQQSTETVAIHAGPDAIKVITRMFAGFWGEGRAPVPLTLAPLTGGRVFEFREFRVDCFPVRHRDNESYGFSFESRVRRHLLPDRLSALGVPDGPVRKKIG